MTSDPNYRDFKESAFAGVIVSADGSILEVTQRFAEQLSPLPATFYDLLHPEDKILHHDAISRVISAGMPATLEARLVGTPLDKGLHRFLLIPMGGGAVHEVAVLLAPQEDAASCREKLAQMKNRLDAIQHEFESLCFSVSHDVRNPLVLIDGFSQALLEDYGEQLKGEAGFYLQRIRAAGRKMAQIIDDLLSISRLMRVEMKYKNVDLTAMLREIVADHLAKMGERQVHVQIAEGLTVYGDKNLLNIICQHLLDNSFKFTSTVADALIDIGLTRINGADTLFIRDNGIGFNQADAEKIFQPFQKLHRPEEFPGTGIGLALVKRAVERHGGRVWGEGNPGKGATFFIIFPAENQVEDKHA